MTARLSLLAIRTSCKLLNAEIPNQSHLYESESDHDLSTTLRDGTQAEGISFSVHDKIRIAEKLDAFGIHYIEGGWPGSNPKDIAFFDAAKRESGATQKSAPLAAPAGRTPAGSEPSDRASSGRRNSDVDNRSAKAGDCMAEGELGETTEENRRMIRESVAYLKSKGKEVMFDAEHFFDGYKDDSDQAMAAIEAAAEGGADVIVLCDTNGGAMLHEVSEITSAVVRALPIPIGIHTHNDCELAVANALAALRSGAVQVQGTINGYGERTGNCNLTSVIPNLQAEAWESGRTRIEPATGNCRCLSMNRRIASTTFERLLSDPQHSPTRGGCMRTRFKR